MNASRSLMTIPAFPSTHSARVPGSSPARMVSGPDAATSSPSSNTAMDARIDNLSTSVAAMVGGRLTRAHVERVGPFYSVQEAVSRQILGLYWGREDSCSNGPNLRDEMGVPVERIGRILLTSTRGRMKGDKDGLLGNPRLGAALIAPRRVIPFLGGNSSPDNRTGSAGRR